MELFLNISFSKGILLILVYSICGFCHEDVVANTRQGLVRGVRINSRVNAFLGVPYAKPPVGELRFTPPQPLSDNEFLHHILDATEFGPVCYQFRYNTVMLENLAATTPESEDCLSVNIFVPRQRRSEELLPTLLWVYGGAFGEGGGSVPYYNPTGLVGDNEGTIVVTLNYRMNIFGFPNTPALPIDGQNLGMRDIRAALEWLRLNLAAFGGDPNKITIGGQSSGADASAAMLYQYVDDPIVRGIIQESGAPEYIGTADDSEFRRVAGIVGCADYANRTKELLCMKQIPAESLKHAISNLTVNPFGSPSGGNPMIDNLTLFSAEEYQRRGEAGLFAKVPTLLGINNNEGDGVIPWSAHGGVNKTASDIITISYFNCPQMHEALFRTKYNVPIWRYRYSPIFPSVTFFPWLRTFHLAEVGMVLGSYRNLTPHKDPQEYEIAASKYIQSSWAAFIRSPTHGLQMEHGWPQFRPNKTTLVELFRDNQPGASFEDPLVYDAICANPPPIPWDVLSEPPPQK